MGLPVELDTPSDPDIEYGVIEFLVDSMYVDDATDQFYKMIIDVEVDSMAGTVLSLQFSDLNNSISDNVVAGTTRGNSMNIQLSVDFMRLFNSVRFQSVNAEEAKAIILQNIEDAIEVN